MTAPTSPVLDLASNLNPYGPPEAACALAAAALCARDPDPSGAAARSSVAEQVGMSPERVLLGHGAGDLAFSCARALASSPCVWLSIEPADSELVNAARRLGARVTRWRSVERTGHRVDLEQVAELMRLEQPQVVSVCAPGDPTGASVPFAQLSSLAASFPETHFVVDQSGLSLSDDHADWVLPPPDNMICIRSLRRELALPGVRVAYAHASTALVTRIDAARPPFSASSAAQALIAWVMEHPEFADDSRERLAADRARLAALLDALGLVYTPSVAPFLLVRVARAEEVARELLEQHGVAVCDATRFGLPDHLRIAAVPAADAERLRAALARVTERRGLVGGRERA
jgi:histidinol-phosphate/aromatic aminotransferase/cobyric acid decarboxylase-like protein